MSLRLVPWGSVNRCEAYIGMPGCGKTSAALKSIVEFRAQVPSYAVVHDPGFRIPPRLHDGTETHVVQHRTKAEAMRGVQRDPGAMHALPNIEDALDVASYLSTATLEKYKGADGRYRHGVPTAVYIDEIVTVAGAGTQRLDERMRTLITQRRHVHTAIWWTCQNVHMVNHALLTLCTRLHMFRCNAAATVERLEKYGALGDQDAAEFAARVARLEKRKYATLVIDPSA